MFKDISSNSDQLDSNAIPDPVFIVHKPSEQNDVNASDKIDQNLNVSN